MLHSLTFNIREQISEALFINVVRRLENYTDSNNDKIFATVETGEGSKSITVSFLPQKNVTPELCKSIIQQDSLRTVECTVKTITCVGCTDSIGKALTGKFGDNLTNLSSNWENCSVQMTVNNNVSNKDIVNCIADAGHEAEVLEERWELRITVDYEAPENELKFQYVVKGVNTQEDIPKINAIIAQKFPMINRFHFDFPTQVLVIYTTLDVNKNTDVGREINSLKLKILRDFRDQLPSPFEVEELNNKATKKPFNKKAKSYFYYAGLNATAGLILGALSGYIPSPLSIFGQYIGLGIGGATLCVMWLTGGQYYRDALSQLFRRQSSNMNTLIALGTGSAWIYSMIMCLAPMLFPAMALQYQFLAVTMILGIVNFGKGVRQIAEENAHKEVQNLEESYRKIQPRRALRKRRLQNDYANQFDFESIPFEEIVQGDILFIPLGQRFPVECRIESKADITIDDQVVLGLGIGSKKYHDEVSTGSKLISVKHNATQKQIFEGVFVKASCDGNNNQLAKIFAQVESSPNYTASDTVQTGSENFQTAKKSILRSGMDTVAKKFVPAIITSAGFSVLGWLLWGPAPQLPMMIASGMSVLVCACPCAFVLASPLANTIAIYKLFIEKILVSTASALEALNKVNTFVFDKTGTLTTPMIVSSVFEEPYQQETAQKELMRYVASLERMFKHPIANSLQHLNDEVEYLPCTSHKNEEGGVSGMVENKNVHMGNTTLMQNAGIQVPTQLLAAAQANDAEGKSSIFIALDKQCVGILVLDFELRPDALSAVQYLHKKQKELYIFTGDTQASANKIATRLGIANAAEKRRVFGDLSPQQKREKLRQIEDFGRVLQESEILEIKTLRKKNIIVMNPTDLEGNLKFNTELSQRYIEENKLDVNDVKEKNRQLIEYGGLLLNPALRANQETHSIIGMVGDGANDVPSMEAAHVSIAVGAGSIAAGKANISMQGLNFDTLLTVAEQTQKTINQNMWWALGYNVVSIVAASGLLYPLFGFVLSPVWASMSMSFSSIFVVTNSTFLSSKLDQVLEELKHDMTNRPHEGFIAQLRNRIKKFGTFLMPDYNPENNEVLNEEDLKRFSPRGPTSSFENKLLVSSPLLSFRKSASSSSSSSASASVTASSSSSSSLHNRNKPAGGLAQMSILERMRRLVY